MDVESQSGRRPIDFHDIQILAYLEKQPLRSTYSPAEILNVSQTTLLNHLRDSLSMKLFHLRWIPRYLTQDLRATRIEKCQELLSWPERMEANKFCNIVTGDESWLTFNYQHSAK
jgi:hypothetical protein